MLFAVAIAAMLLVGGDDKPALPEVVLFAEKQALPSRTARDWVTYGDHIVVATVTGEKSWRPLPEGEEGLKAGPPGRSVTLTFAESLWDRPGAAALPATPITMNADGWTLQSDVRIPLAPRGGSRLEVGHTYLVSLVRLKDGSWLTQGSGGALPFDGRVLGQGEYEGRTTTAAALALAGSAIESPVLRAHLGKDAAELSEALARTAPDPAAAPYADLDPFARYAAASGNDDRRRAAETFCARVAPLTVSARGCGERVA